VVEGLLDGRAIPDLVDAPRMTDPRARMVTALLEASGPPIYMVRPALFPWITLQLVSHSLRHGNAEASCYGYGIYALLRAAVAGDVDGGYAFSQLAIALNERLGDLALKGCMLHLLGDHVNFWKNHVAGDLPILERGFRACLEGGDLIYSNYIGFQAPWHLYESGAPLDDVHALAEKYAVFALQSRYLAVHQTIRLEQRFVDELTGRAAPGDAAATAAAFAEIAAAGFGCGVAYHHILRLISRYTFGDHAGALAAARLAEPALGAVFSMPIQVSFGLYHALTLAALYPAASADERAAALAAMEGHRDRMRGWARACPANFAHKAALIGAEVARAAGRTAEAMGLYDEAVAGARAGGFVQYQALACERAAELYLAAGAASVGALLMAEARALYRRWGALAKATHLEAAHPALGDHPWERGTLTRATESSNTARKALDLLPVLKASQSISAEMVLPRLLERLMEIVIEYAGAERGCLILADGDALRVAAEADANRAVTLAQGGAEPSAAALPMSVLQYVRRTGERVILDDATRPNTFSSDAYLARGQARSVLCIPVARRQTLTGMFYLENNLVTGAFSPERLEVLAVLAAQTAISIDNSRLYEASQDAIRVRDDFLSIASHELKTPLTPLRLRLQLLSRHIRGGTLADLGPERLARLADTIDVQVARLVRLVDGLLDVSRIHAGKFTLHREAIDLGALAASVVERHAAELAAARCVATVSAPEPVAGEWDPMRLEQLVANLLTNAAKYAPGSPVAVTVSRAGDLARLVVHDRGIGISVEDAGHIFDRFVRVASTEHVGGLGLGLFISRQIAEAHGGSIRVESTPGAGAAFVVELPVAPTAGPRVRA
jgi:signal transduction histidine kinase